MDTIIFWLIVVIGIAFAAFTGYVLYGIFLKDRPKKEKVKKVSKSKTKVVANSKKQTVDEDDDDEITLVNLEKKSETL